MCVDIFPCMWADLCAPGEYIFLGIGRYAVPFAWQEHSEQRIWETDVCVRSQVSCAALLSRQRTKKAPILTRLCKVFSGHLSKKKLHSGTIIF